MPEPLNPPPLNSALPNAALPESALSRDSSATLVVESAIALVCIGLGWLLVRIGLNDPTSWAEREHLANHAALCLACLALPWAISGSSRSGSSKAWRVSLWALTTPFLALLLLPPGLRRFAPLVLLVTCLAILWGWLCLTTDAKRTRPPASPFVLSASWVSAGAAVAILMRPDAVPVPFEVRELIGVVARGAAFGAAACWLGWEWRERAGRIGALSLAGAALVFSGPSATAALVLAACAGTSSWIRRRAEPLEGSLLARWAPLVPWAPLAALAPPAAALLAFGTWGARVRRGWLAALIVTTALLALWLEPRPWQQTALDLGFAALLLGPMWLGLPLERDAPSATRLWRLASGAALAVVGLRFFPSHLVLPVVAAQVLRPDPEAAASNASSSSQPEVAFPHHQRPLLHPCTIWIGAWTVATMLLACYPWMRPPMLASQWRWALGEQTGVLLGLLACGTALGCLLVALAHRNRGPSPSWASGALALLCAGLSATALSSREPLGAEVLQRWPPRTLSAQSPQLLYPLSPTTSPGAPTIWIDGATAGSLDVPPDTEIARVRLDLPNGRWEADLVLGRDVWDWRLPAPRTRRSDAGPPAPMFFWWTGSPEDTTLARRYRARLELERKGEGTPPWRLRLERSPKLPDGTTIDIRQLAVRGASLAEELR